jgi:predicted secreted protein
MATKVTGKNIMLYKQQDSTNYYFNGATSQGTILGSTYYQINRNNEGGAAANFTRIADGDLASFITNSGDPNSTSIAGGVWVFKNYLSLSTNTAGTPMFAITIAKFDGTTLTPIASSDSVYFTSTSPTLYTTNVTVPTTTMASTDRLVVKVVVLNLTGRTATLYTEGTYINYFTSTIAYDIPFACSTSCTFNVNVNQKEVTSQTSAWYREYKNDIASWIINCDGIITLDNYGYLFLLQQQQNRTTIVVKFVIDNGANGLVIITGKCNLTSLSINGPWKDIATYSVSLQGTGPYGTSGTTINPQGVVITSATPVYTKQYIATGGESTVTWTDMVGRNCLYVSRGGIDVREILTSGTPTGDQVKWDSATGTLTFGRVLAATEFIRGLFN